MKKLVVLLMSIFVLFALGGCGSSNANGAASSNTAQEKSSVATAQSSNGSAQETVKQDKKVLVAYFSWSGNTRKVAEQIHERVGGDIFEIKPEKPYPKEYNDCVEYAKQEKANNGRPAMENKVANIEDYDVVFMGYPIWWYDAPMIIDTFLESYNFSGKTIIPFCTSGGSGIEESMGTIKKLCPNSTVMDGITANDVSTVEPWLKKLGMTK